MSITRDQLLHITKLAQIGMTDEELDKLHHEFTDILTFIEHLFQVPVAGVVPTSHVHGVTNFFREDVVKESLPVEDVQKNAPDFANGYFRVPKII